MDDIDMNLSDLDILPGFSFFQNQPTSRHQLLGIWYQGKFYEFRLETFHLFELQHYRNSISEHCHEVYHAVLYLYGNALMYKGDKIEVPPSSLVLISPGEPHSFAPQSHERSCYHELTFRLMHRSEALYLSWSQLLSLYTGNPEQSFRLPQSLSPTEAQSLTQCYEQLSETLKSRKQQSESFIHLIRMLLLIERIPFKSPGLRPETVRLNEAKAFIEQNYHLEMDLNLLSSFCKMSKEHFCRRFKSAFGQAPMTYRHKLRLEAAKRMLCFSELEIKEIAERLGFADVYHFTKSFHRYFGTPPGKLRHRRNHSP